MVKFQNHKRPNLLHKKKQKPRLHPHLREWAEELLPHKAQLIPEKELAQLSNR
jgi:hypothetical protein